MLCEIRSYIGTRSYQEDSADKCETEKGLFVVVCDGIGSRAEGGASSRLATERFLEYFRTRFKENYPSFIVDAASRIDDEVYKTYGEGCGTTAVTAYVSGSGLYWLSVGDSRLYILRDRKLTQITTTHNYSYVIDVRLRKKLIDEATYKAEQSKGERLASFIGMGGIDIVDVNTQPFKLRSGDRLLLTTDGLYKSIGDERIAEILNSNENISLAADRLMEAVKSCEGSIDNTTFAIIDHRMEES